MFKVPYKVASSSFVFIAIHFNPTSDCAPAIVTCCCDPLLRNFIFHHEISPTKITQNLRKAERLY